MGNVTNIRLGSTTRSFTYYPGAGNGGNPNSVIPEVSNVTENGVSEPISYDYAGNNAGGSAYSVYYDADERLSGTANAVQEVVQFYNYDGFNRRVITQLTNGNERDFIFDPSDHLLSETPQFSNTATTPPTQPDYDYIWFGDRPVAQVDSTGTHWTYSDHLGTPLIQTNSSGTVTWQAEYEPYGSIYALRAGSTVHQPLRLPGQSAEQFDTGANGNSPVSYNNARWYQPDWGSYTQPDPMGLSTGPNPYAYADEGPIRQIDPLGLDVYVGFHFITQLDPIADALEAITGSYVNAGHLFIDITRDGQEHTLSGEPTIPWGAGFLNSDRDADLGEGPCRHKISPPPGMSEDAFERALLNADKNYATYHNNQLLYLPNEDSNSYISGLMGAVGEAPPSNPSLWFGAYANHVVFPGYNEPVGPSLFQPAIPVPIAGAAP